jgi:hypothetical protein
MAYKDPEKRRAAQRRWRNSGKLPLATRHCEYCGAEYEPRRPWAKFCSTPCLSRSKCPIRSPEDAADGTPWHLRDDLGRKEWQLLTPEQKRERDLWQHRKHEAARRDTPEGLAYRVAYNKEKSILLGRRGPDRDPHPAKDGTPWHLRLDLYFHEITALTPEEKADRVRALGRDKARRLRGGRPPRPMRDASPLRTGPRGISAGT